MRANAATSVGSAAISRQRRVPVLRRVGDASGTGRTCPGPRRDACSASIGWPSAGRHLIRSLSRNWMARRCAQVVVEVGELLLRRQVALDAAARQSPRSCSPWPAPRRGCRGTPARAFLPSMKLTADFAAGTSSRPGLYSASVLMDGLGGVAAVGRAYWKCIGGSGSGQWAVSSRHSCGDASASRLCRCSLPTVPTAHFFGVILMLRNATGPWSPWNISGPVAASLPVSPPGVGSSSRRSRGAPRR